MDELIIIIVLALVVLITGTFIRRPGRQALDDGLPYGMRKYFLTPAELNCFQALLRAVDNHVIVCPKYGSEMILRTAKKGANAGKQFWSCSGYPNCRTMLPLEEPL